MLDSNKSTNFNKKSHFKAFVYISYDTYDFSIWYNLYDTHAVLYDSWALTIRWYDMELFPHDRIRIVQYVSRIVQYWQLWLVVLYNMYHIVCKKFRIVSAYRKCSWIVQYSVSYELFCIVKALESYNTVYVSYRKIIRIVRYINKCFKIRFFC